MEFIKIIYYFTSISFEMIDKEMIHIVFYDILFILYLLFKFQF